VCTEIFTDGFPSFLGYDYYNACNRNYQGGITGFHLELFALLGAGMDRAAVSRLGTSPCAPLEPGSHTHDRLEAP